MRITVANKPVKGDKPRTKLESKTYFNNLQFHSETISPEEFESIVGNGYTISYTYKDNKFYRKDDYTKNNYVGTDYIVIDVDSIIIDPETFISGIKYKPTLYHTTFSNLTSYKGYKYCYHLVYCLDEFITGEDNFRTLFYLLSKDYWEKVDKKAKDCHRCIFTSNSELPNYQYRYLGRIYSPSELLKDVDLNTIKLEVEKAYSVNKNSKTKDKKQLEDKFSLEKDFYDDLYSSSWEEIIVKYSTNFKFWISTKIDPSRYQNGYVDLRNDEYYTVPSWKLIYDKKEGKAIIPKVKNGHRNNMLWQDALAFMAIIPDITKENLVYCLIRTVYHHYDYEYNNDRITTTDIIQKAREAWNGTYTKNPTKKKFKINTIEYKKQGRTDWIKISNEIRRDMKDNDFGSLYDFNASVEDNLKVFHEQGLKTKKNTLIKWLKDKGYDYFTDKDERNKLVIELYKENPNRSSREIEKLCKERGIKVKDKTISTIINRCVKMYPTSILSEDSNCIYRSTVKNYAVSNNNIDNLYIEVESKMGQKDSSVYKEDILKKQKDTVLPLQIPKEGCPSVANSDIMGSLVGCEYINKEDKEKEDNNDIKDKDKESAKLHSIVYSSFCDGYKEDKEKEDNNDIKDKDKEYIKEDSFKYDWDWIKDVGEYILNDPFMQSHRRREYAIKIGLIKEVPEESVKPEMKFNIETTDFKQKKDNCPSCANIDSILQANCPSCANIDSIYEDKLNIEKRNCPSCANIDSIYEKEQTNNNCPSCANIDSIYEDKKEIKNIIKNDSEIPQKKKISKQEELKELKNKLTLDGITTDFLGIHNYTKDIDVRMISSNNQDSFESMFI